MSIVLEGVTKYFEGVKVVDRVSLEVQDGEFFVLVGTSGSGKSTVLRLIAGLAFADEGRILLRGKDVTRLPPQERGTGFVFQNYSIFRHMTLAENVEFGLRIRKVAAPERARRARELLELVGLGGLGDRYPSQISGGQQQRVALARALAYEPTVLLLDEPLGALDVQIRQQVRRSLSEIHARLGVTTIMVTHDQDEAFELADRIGVLAGGSLLEVGEPEELYARPRTHFVATFLGSGTVLAGRVEEGQARFGDLRLPIPDDLPHDEAAPVEVLVRPEQVLLTRERPDDDEHLLGKGTVVEHTFSGPLRRLRLRLPRLPGTRQLAPTPPFGEEGTLVDALVSSEFSPAGDELWVTLRGWTVLEEAPPRLLVVDGGKGTPDALALAASLAGRLGGGVRALGWVEEESDEVRERLRGRLRGAGLGEADLSVRAGGLARQVAAETAGELYDLVVLPRAPHGGLHALDPEVVSLIENATLPALLVGKEAPAAVRRVLICVRLGEPAKDDVRFGGRLARQLGASVTLLHATGGNGAETASTPALLEQAVRSLGALEVPCDVRLEPGQPLAEILAAAEEHDLVVLGSHGPPSLSVFGSDDVTLSVLARGKAPVLVVPAGV